MGEVCTPIGEHRAEGMGFVGLCVRGSASVCVCVCVCVRILMHACVRWRTIPVDTGLVPLVGSRLWPYYVGNAYADWLLGRQGHLVGQEGLRVGNHGAVMVAVGTHFPATGRDGVN